jgi:hypothetical protein
LEVTGIKPEAGETIIVAVCLSKRRCYGEE